MSGHAAIALVLLRDRGQFATLTIRRLGEPIPPSQGETPFSLDFYLSLMSPPGPQFLTCSPAPGGSTDSPQLLIFEHLPKVYKTALQNWYSCDYSFRRLRNGLCVFG